MFWKTHVLCMLLFSCEGRKNKMAAPASDWVRYLRLLLGNRWREFNRTWHTFNVYLHAFWRWKKRIFHAKYKKLGAFLATRSRLFSNLPIKFVGSGPYNRVSRFSWNSTLFFFGHSKQKWPTWPIHQKGGTLYSGARYVALWASCYLIPLWAM